MKDSRTITEKDMPQIAHKVVETLASIAKEEARVLFLEGDLGAGKTTFTKEIAEILGVQKEDVHSPTFILKKEYRAEHPVFKKLIHIDAYRFETKDEARALRLEEDLKDSSSLIVVEWPSKMSYENPDMMIRLTVIDDETREMEVNL